MMSDCTQCADYEWCAKNEECGMFKQKQMTNADRIRSMTDEDLAIFLANLASCPECNARIKDCGINCWEAWLDWLKQETDDGD